MVAPARAVTDAALRYRSAMPVRALVTGAVQRRRCTPEQLLAEWREVPRQHSMFLRLALEDVAAGARSVAEAIASQCLRAPGIPPFVMNAEIRDAQGVMIVDVYWPELRAALEVDSREYHFSEADWKATMARHNRLAVLGIAVTHYPPSVISARKGSWLDEVRVWLSRRARELRVPIHDQG
jgi:hypothetical protein